MPDTTVAKIDSTYSPIGDMGQKCLVSGKRMAMRMWEAYPPRETHEHARPYETVGFVISGRAELHVEGQVVALNPGDSWVVPREARHRYVILEPFTAIEVTSPPAQVHGRDEAAQRETHGGTD